MAPSTVKIVNDINRPEFFKLFQEAGYGDLYIKQDRKTNMLAIIAIHSTQLGPALGGCRFRHYESVEDAIIDVLRLAHGMSYKAAISGLALGGGKSVIIRPPGDIDRGSIFRAFGRFVQSLNGLYISAEDSGTSVEEMDIIRTVTPFVTGNTGQQFTQKDPSPLTALGILRGIEAAVRHHLNRHTLKGLKVAIQGTGHVGYQLAKQLHEKGASILVSDLNAAHLERAHDEFNATIIPPTQIHTSECDVYSPCALSNAITFDNFHEIKAPIIAGSANNQLESEELATVLKEKGKLYVPDYVINAGGLIHVYAQYYNKDENEAKEKIKDLYNTLTMIFKHAQREDVPPLTIANRIAQERLQFNTP